MILIVCRQSRYKIFYYETQKTIYIKGFIALMSLFVIFIIAYNPKLIITMTGDHGPFLTKNGYGLNKERNNFKEEDIERYDIQDRFGFFCYTMA